MPEDIKVDLSFAEKADINENLLNLFLEVNAKLSSLSDRITVIENDKRS